MCILKIKWFIWCVINLSGIDMHFDTHFLNLEYYDYNNVKS
jgi:hypothetical protein